MRIEFSINISGGQKKSGNHVQYLMKSAILSACLSVCLNSSETVRRTNITLSTIDHHREASAIRVGDVTTTSPLKISLFNLHF